MSGMDAGGKGGKGNGDGGKPKKGGGGFWAGLRQFGSDFAESFARNVSVGVGTGGKPSPVDYSKQMNDERQSAAKQIHRSMKAWSEKAPLAGGRTTVQRKAGADVDEGPAGNAEAAADEQSADGAELEGAGKAAEETRAEDAKQTAVHTAGPFSWRTF